MCRGCANDVVGIDGCVQVSFADCQRRVRTLDAKKMFMRKMRALNPFAGAKRSNRSVWPFGRSELKNEKFDLLGFNGSV